MGAINCPVGRNGLKHELDATKKVLRTGFWRAEMPAQRRPRTDLRPGMETTGWSRRLSQEITGWGTPWAEQVTTPPVWLEKLATEGGSYMNWGPLDMS